VLESTSSAGVSSAAAKSGGIAKALSTSALMGIVDSDGWLKHNLLNL
jgi:hypothetical protein